MKSPWMLVGVVVFGVLALTAVRVGAQAVEPTGASYSWSGELVAFDAGTRTITVKSRVVGDQALAELPTFKAGDRIVLTWSGFDTYADAVSRAVRFDAGKSWSDRFTFPVEFVAYESPRQYVTFKFQVPQASVSPVAALKPGEWVTATSRHRPASETEAIASVRPYAQAAASSTTN